ncbi:hypothetical protein [Bacillus thuringiensis]|uniref:hypothetical protein n=1 Tax=Bacillus thuringiensis TaxID=1428 RepID=UPI0021D67967|nr:hypothetical protein [Bacillus thuringiensis]MCU7667872.1 hypothetical protein [Bacillus thuringiensis]
MAKTKKQSKITKKMKKKMRHGGKLTSDEAGILKRSLKKQGIRYENNPYHNQIKDFLVVVDFLTEGEYLFFKFQSKQYVINENAGYIYQLDLNTKTLIYADTLMIADIKEVLRVKRERRIQNHQQIEIPVEDDEFSEGYEEQMEWLKEHLSDKQKELIAAIPYISEFDESFQEEMDEKFFEEELD